MEQAWVKPDIASRLAKAKAVIFDWDGVFNLGTKGLDKTSLYSERDSMGTNMLRYGLWKQNGEVPLSMVVSGANNRVAHQLAGREHFHYEVSGALFKSDVVLYLLGQHDIKEDEVIFFYDDILDLSVAEWAGVRCQMRYESSPMLNRYVDDHDLADCWVRVDQPTGHVRRACDVLLMHLPSGQDVIADRAAFNDSYQAYFSARQAINTVHEAAGRILESKSDMYLSR